MANPPLLSVVIPTHGRQRQLPGAINSALESSPGGDVEVIIVPNGDDNSWQPVALRYATDPRVCWLPIHEANANAARNHGLRMATGICIRFLDDDDYLYPAPCRSQCLRIIADGYDISSGGVDVVGSDGKCIRTLRQPDTDDYTTSVLTPSRMTQPGGHIYRRSAISMYTWEEDRPVRQDTAWTILLAASRDFSWHKCDDQVAAWVQHTGRRISKGRDPGHTALKETSELIQRSAAQLIEQGRFTEERRRAAADGLWSSLQKGLQYDLSYWASVAATAATYAPDRRPPSAIHRMPLFKKLPPLFVERLLIPARILYRPIRRILDRFGINRV